MTDGPFIEGKEHLGGFTIVRAADLDAALAWAPQAARGDALPIEVRPFAGERTEATAGRDADRARLPRRVRPRRGRARPRLRRHRVGRRSGPGRLRHRAGALAGERPRRRARPAGSSPPRATAPSIACGAKPRATTATRRRRCCMQADGGRVEEDDAVHDDRLRLIFTCCHPALAPAARVALTLRLLGGLHDAEIARAFLVPGADHGAAPGAREGQDPRRRHPLSRAGRGRSPGPPRRRARRRLPDLQRGLRGHRRAIASCARTCAPRRSASAACWRP